jgi:hypothetical protein
MNPPTTKGLPKLEAFLRVFNVADLRNAFHSSTLMHVEAKPGAGERARIGTDMRLMNL